MNPTDVKGQLLVILKSVQQDSGLECPVLTGKTRPTIDVPKFDSKVWPVATTMLATELRIMIPDNVNIFIDEKTKEARSVDQIAQFVHNLASNKSAAVAAA
jgi:hypothetical protein